VPRAARVAATHHGAGSSDIEAASRALGNAALALDRVTVLQRLGEAIRCEAHGVTLDWAAPR